MSSTSHKHVHHLVPRHDHLAPDVLIEFAEAAHKTLDHVHDAADHITKFAKIYYGHHAFRKYPWIKELIGLKASPHLNGSGNLRGMVLDKKARSLFTVTVEFGEKLEKMDKILVAAGWAVELAKSKTYIERVMQSNEGTATKSQKICTEVSLATLRALTGVAPTAYHMVASALRKGAHLAHAPTRWEYGLSRSDLWVKTHYEQITNTENIVHFINSHLVL